MRYFSLEDDMSERMRYRWHVGEILLPDGTEPLLTSGIQLEGQRQLYASVTHAGYVLDFCHTSFAVPIATYALANAIKEVAGADVQCISVTISGQSGMIVLNSIRMVSCVCEQHSEFDKWTENDGRPDKLGQYHYVSKLVLCRDAIPLDAHFFRIKDWDVALIVSETVKNAMERVGCYGAEFTELELA